MQIQLTIPDGPNLATAVEKAAKRLFPLNVENH